MKKPAKAEYQTKNCLTKRHVHVWTPGMYSSKGGIETYSAHLLRALREMDFDNRFEVFSKHDTVEGLNRSAGSNMHFHCAGSFPLRIRTLVFAAQIAAHALWKRPDLIITTHLNFAPVAHRLRQLSGVPYWIVAHGIEAWNITRPAFRAALHEADKVLAVSSYTRNRLLAEQALDPSRVGIQPNTIDEARFSLAPKPPHLLERYGLLSDQPVILTVSRLASGEQYKGYDKIIRAIPSIRRHVPDVRYLIVGKGDDRGRVEQLIAELDVQDCVMLAGFVPDEELCAHYNLCDVFAMPSKGEGFGIVYLEAMACGKPVLAGDRDGALDALCDGELGVLVNPDDTEEIAEKLIAILQCRYSHPVMDQPQLLRQRMLEAYGFNRFKETLASHVDEFRPSGDYHQEVCSVESSVRS